jgi:hypothetical protein
VFGNVSGGCIFQLPTEFPERERLSILCANVIEETLEKLAVDSQKIVLLLIVL